MQNGLPPGKNSEEKNSKASIIFMLFGLALVFSSVFLFNSRKSHVSQSSISPQGADSIEMKKRLEGIEINNQRSSAEVRKNEAMSRLGTKALNKVEPSDIEKGVELSPEPNNQLHIHDRLQSERSSYPDVSIPAEVESDHQALEQAIEEEQQDRADVIRQLKARAAAENLNLKFNAATGEVSVERIPQSDANSNVGGNGNSK